MYLEIWRIGLLVLVKITKSKREKTPSIQTVAIKIIVGVTNYQGKKYICNLSNNRASNSILGNNHQKNRLLLLYHLYLPKEKNRFQISQLKMIYFKINYLKSCHYYSVSWRTNRMIRMKEINNSNNSRFRFRFKEKVKGFHW